MTFLRIVIRSIFLFEHDLRANAFRVCREGKPVSTFPDHALAKLRFKLRHRVQPDSALCARSANWRARFIAGLLVPRIAVIAELPSASSAAMVSRAQRYDARKISVWRSKSVTSTSIGSGGRITASSGPVGRVS